MWQFALWPQPVTAEEPAGVPANTVRAVRPDDIVLLGNGDDGTCAVALPGLVCNGDIIVPAHVFRVRAP